jgi:hypothetical protein
MYRRSQQEAGEICGLDTYGFAFVKMPERDEPAEGTTTSSSQPFEFLKKVVKQHQGALIAIDNDPR